MYPKLCPQPMKGEYLLIGLPEQTNSVYVAAKAASLKIFYTYLLSFL